jgi:hypothetical protein
VKFVVRHLPHIVPSVLGFGVVLWLWFADARAKRRGEGVHAEAAPAAVPVPAPLPRRRPDGPVRLEAARRGILLLGPILAATATGAVIYAIDLDSGHPGRGLAWFHSGFGTLVLLLAVYKLADADPKRLRAGWRLGRVLETAGSLLLAVLLVPLLITGIALLAAPSSASFSAYAHLVAGAWWTVLVLWHLWRYLVRAVRSVRRTGTVPNT